MALLALCAGVGSVTVASAKAGASPRAAASARDRAVTVAYLRAQLAYEKAVVAAAPASKAALEGLASRLDGECAGVVAGVAPSMRSDSPEPRSARVKGEENRKQRQWTDLTDELNRAIQLARNGPYRQAALAFARTARTLRWSDAMVTADEHANARSVEWEVDGAVPAVCADMRFWVQSGYTRISASTKAFVSEREAALRPLSRMVQRLYFESPLALFSSNPLARYEGPHARALSRTVNGMMDNVYAGALKSVFDTGRRIRIALGVTTEAELKALQRETAKLAAEQKRRRSETVTIGKGRTAAGSSYTIWVESRGRHGGAGGVFEAFTGPRGCRRGVGISESERQRAGEPFVVSGEPSVACLSRSHPMAPRVRCEGEVRTVEAQTLAGARRVRLTLADGRHVLSPVAALPRRLVGPAGFYYQALAVWDSPPVSLTELNARGRPLKTLPVAHQPKCVTQWPFIRPGIQRRIAHGSLPGGQGFSILASREETAGARLRAVEPSLWVEVGGKRSFGGIKRRDGPFEWQLETGCEPHEYAILYGILAKPRDTVWARTAGRLHRLRRVRIPASLHPHGVLAYAAFPTVPSEMIVRTPGGKTVRTRKLTHIARETRETCEGEAEPAG